LQISAKKIFAFSLVLHLLGAIFSSGFHHFDEHFQILEFMGLKLGLTTEAQLPWEFHEQMRSWFQPYFYLIFYKFFNALRIDSPFFFATFFRMLTGVLNIWGLWLLIPFLKEKFRDERYFKISLLLLNFCWFIPYIHVRSSAESLGASLFVIGFALFQRGIKEKHCKFDLVSGLLFGFSFLSRFHLGFMVASLWFWAMVIKKSGVKKLSLYAIGVIASLLLGLCIDFLGYGTWTSSAYNFFYQNIVEGKVNSFGRDVWWFYFSKGGLKGIPPISLVLIGATFWAFFKLKKDPIVWISAPFMLIHILVAHKEVRFLFPLYIWMPYFLAQLIYFYRSKIEENLKRPVWSGLKNFLIILNCLILFISVLKPANPSTLLYKYIWEKGITNLNFFGENPYTMLGLNINFYKKKDLQLISVKDLDTELSKERSKKAYYFFPKGHYLAKVAKYPQCQMTFITYPRWALKVNIGNWVGRSRVWSVFECK
jgi:phosphatidylinositol glycan class B